MKYVAAGLVVVAISGAMSCGNGNGVAPFSSGIAANRAFTSLNDQEKQQFCNAVGNYDAASTAASRDSSCRSSALFSARNAADPVMACTSQYNMCIARPVTQTSSDTVSQCVSELAVVTCDLTVGEFESCISESADAENASYAAIPTCAQASKTYQPPAGQSSGTAPCLAQIETRCPELFGKNTQTTGSGNTGGTNGTAQTP